MRRSGAVWKLGLATLVVAAVIAGVIASISQADRQVSTGGTPDATEAVAPGNFTDHDARPGTVVLDWQRGKRVRYVGDAGTVTDVNIATGSPITSGTSLFEVDGRTVFAIDSSAPLYRDLKLGDEGRDVAALEQFLASFALIEPHDRTRLDRDMTEAVRAFNALTGRRSLGATFAHSAVAWIGAADSGGSPVKTVLVEPGELLTGPTAIFETDAVIVAAHGEVDAADRPASSGARVADLALAPAVTVQLTADTYLLDASQYPQLVDIAPRPDFGDTEFAVTKLAVATRLAEPAEFQVLPVAAVVTSRTGTTCVYSPQGVASPIRIAGTEPGIVLVTKETALPELVLAPPVGIDGCDT